MLATKRKKKGYDQFEGVTNHNVIITLIMTYVSCLSCHVCTFLTNDWMEMYCTYFME